MNINRNIKRNACFILNTHSHDSSEQFLKWVKKLRAPPKGSFYNGSTLTCSKNTVLNNFPKSQNDSYGRFPKKVSWMQTGLRYHFMKNISLGNFVECFIIIPSFSTKKVTFNQDTAQKMKSSIMDFFIFCTGVTTLKKSSLLVKHS